MSKELLEQFEKYEGDEYEIEPKMCAYPPIPKYKVRDTIYVCRLCRKEFRKVYLNYDQSFIWELRDHYMINHLGKK